MRFRNPNFSFKSAGAEEGRSLPSLTLFPSLPFPNLLEEEAGRRLYSMTTSKICRSLLPPPSPCSQLSPFPFNHLIPTCYLPPTLAVPSNSKPCRLGSHDSLLQDILVGASFTQLLSWYMQWPQNNDVFLMFESKVNWFLSTWFSKGIRSRGLNKRERRDDLVVCAELPPELWEQIGKRLVSRLDIICFRLVCKACRSSLPSPTRFPLWVPRPPCTDPDLSVLENVPYFITEHTIYSVDVGSEGDIQRVLMQFEELGQGGKLRRYAFLPKGDEFGFPMESCTAPSLDHQLSQHSFLGKAYLLRMALPRFDSLKHRVKGKWDFQSTAMEVCKIVVISSNADGVDAVNYVPASKLSVVALLRDKTRLALLRLGGSQDPNWGWDTSFCSGSFFDIAAYKGKLCAVDCWGSAFIMDYKSLKMTRIAAPLSKHPLLGGWNQLVETCGDLYLVVKRLQPEPIDGVKVYKLSLRLRRWVQVDNIGNQVFFRELSFGISVRRDFLTGSYEKLMLKCKGQRRYFGVPSFLFMHDHEDDDGCVCGDIDYCFLGLTMRHCTPQLPVQEAQTAPTLTTTSSILSEYDNSIVGRVHYLDIIRCNGNLVGRTSYPDLIRTTGHLG